MKGKSLVAAIFAALLLSLLISVVVFAQTKPSEVALLLTATPKPSATSTKTLTVTNVVTSITVLKNANLRAGPGTSYAVAGTVKQGQTLTIVGKSGDWYQLNGKQWIAAFLVKITKSPATIAMATPTRALTKTPVPTSTPLSKATSTPTIEPTKIDFRNDPVTQAYVADVTEALDFFVAGSDAMGAQFTEASTDISLLTDDDWKLKTVLALTRLGLFADGVRKLKPPTYLVDMNNDLLTAADHIDTCIYLLGDGIDKFDASKIKKGMSEFQLATTAINSSKEKINKFLQEND